MAIGSPAKRAGAELTAWGIKTMDKTAARLLALQWHGLTPAYAFAYSGSQFLTNEVTAQMAMGAGLGLAVNFKDINEQPVSSSDEPQAQERIGDAQKSIAAEPALNNDTALRKFADFAKTMEKDPVLRNAKAAQQKLPELFRRLNDSFGLSPRDSLKLAMSDDNRAIDSQLSHKGVGSYEAFTECRSELRGLLSRIRAGQNTRMQYFEKLQSLSDSVMDDLRLPKVGMKLVPDSEIPGSFGEFSGGGEDIRISETAAKDPKELVFTAVEELGHNEQFFLRFCKRADELNIGRTCTNDQLQDLYKEYISSANDPDEKAVKAYFEDCLRLRDGRRLTVEETKRATELEVAEKLTPEVNKGMDRSRRVVNIYNDLKKGTSGRTRMYLIASKNGSSNAYLARDLGVSEVPEEVRLALQSGDEEKLRTSMLSFLDKKIPEFKAEAAVHYQKYRSKFDEQEMEGVVNKLKQLM
jgi:hypothetical protein